MDGKILLYNSDSSQFLTFIKKLTDFCTTLKIMNQRETKRASVRGVLKGVINNNNIIN